MDRARPRFERYLRRRFGQKSTLKRYIRDPNIFIDTIGHTLPEAVTAEDINTFADQQIAAGPSPGTINRRLVRVGTLRWTLGRALMVANRR
jgi:hypothetical protein